MRLRSSQLCAQTRYALHACFVPERFLARCHLQEAAKEHDSCTNNLYNALKDLGLSLTKDPRYDYYTPAPFNLWMNVAPEPDHTGWVVLHACFRHANRGCRLVLVHHLLSLSACCRPHHTCFLFLCLEGQLSPRLGLSSCWVTPILW